jgi:hypothetical protein
VEGCRPRRLLRRQIGEETKHAAVPEPPVGRQNLIVPLRRAESRTGEPGRERRRARVQQFADQCEALPPGRARARLPVKLGRPEGGFRERVRNVFAVFRIGGLELLPTSFAHGLRERAVKIAEERKRPL